MYHEVMSKDEELWKIGTAEQRFAEALRLHEIEGNPLSVDTIKMFEMFRREGWSHEKRRAYIIAQIEEQAGTSK